MTLMNKAGLYIHVPFCSSKCNYCDFNSYTGKLDKAEDYFNCMKKEIGLYHDEMNYNLIDTIFIGGGTPSCVDSKYIGEILGACWNEFNISENCEITIESNPGTIDEEKLSAYKSFGINRLSIGFQAYQTNILKYLGRQHSTVDFTNSINLAKRVGFKNINADVIFGIPGQTLDNWRETLKVLTDAGLNHISAYSLKIEEGTRFGDMLQSGKLIQIDEELDREMYHYAIDYLLQNGYQHYELSNFAKPGFECQHNLTYWKCVDYLGLGAGAHSYLQSIRCSNAVSIEDYISYLSKGEKPTEERYVIDFYDKMSEYMFLGLRLTKGIENKQFEDIFNQNLFEKYAESIERLKNKKLIETDGERVWLSKLGLDLANQVFMEFV